MVRFARVRFQKKSIQPHSKCVRGFGFRYRKEFGAENGSIAQQEFDLMFGRNWRDAINSIIFLQ